MSLLTNNTTFVIGLCLGLSGLIIWRSLHIWYFQLVYNASARVRDRNGEIVPGLPPKVLVGNLVDVYSARNHLSAYNSFHQNFGEIVQIFWLWRQQISVSNYAMARQILVNNQRNYQKFTPNYVLQKLFGTSVLTLSSTTNDWKRDRFLLNEIFSQKSVVNFHRVFVDYSERLVDKWKDSIERTEGSLEINIYPQLLALFLDIVGQVAIGKDFAALEGKAKDFLNSLQYIVYQSTRPAHQFTTWWKYVPLPSNRQLDKAFHAVNDFVEQLIVQKKAISEPQLSNVLESLLRSQNESTTELGIISDREIRDNLLAIIANGHETVATSVSFSLYLLARHPGKLARARFEVDSIMEEGKLTEAGVTKLDYLNAVIWETLRFTPPMAGLQRISRDSDNLEGWSIPANQVIGITLKPLHDDPKYFGDGAEEFHPERYLDGEDTMPPAPLPKISADKGQCPLKRFWRSEPEKYSKIDKNPVCMPLSFGDGARKCVGEHFAMYEMKVVLAVLLYHFNFQVAPNFEAELELGKFGLFLTSFPKEGVKMSISSRNR